MSPPSSRARPTTAASTRAPAPASASAPPAVETDVAALAEDGARVVEEAADLVFHLSVLLASRGLDPAAVEDELARRAAPGEGVA